MSSSPSFSKIPQKTNNESVGEGYIRGSEDQTDFNILVNFGKFAILIVILVLVGLTYNVVSNSGVIVSHSKDGNSNLVSENITILESLTLKGSLFVEGDIINNGSEIIENSLTVGNLKVNGNATFVDSLLIGSVLIYDAPGTLTIVGGLVVNGDTYLDTLFINGTKIVNGINGTDSTVPGPQGPPGKDGRNGTDSTVPGPQGSPGKDGQNGTDSTVAGKDGRNGTDSTVPGPAGKDGRNGTDSTVPGPQGPPGFNGTNGKDSTVPGPAGFNSTVPGPQGPAGFNGTSIVGPQGAPGLNCSFNVLVFTSVATVGGAAAETVTVTGLLTTDTVLSVTQTMHGGSNLPILYFDNPITISGQITLHWVADPGSGATVIVAVKR